MAEEELVLDVSGVCVCVTNKQEIIVFFSDLNHQDSLLSCDKIEVETSRPRFCVYHGDIFIAAIILERVFLIQV